MLTGLLRGSIDVPYVATYSAADIPVTCRNKLGSRFLARSASRGRNLGDLSRARRGVRSAAVIPVGIAGGLSAGVVMAAAWFDHVAGNEPEEVAR